MSERRLLRNAVSGPGETPPAELSDPEKQRGKEAEKDLYLVDMNQAEQERAKEILAAEKLLKTKPDDVKAYAQFKNGELMVQWIGKYGSLHTRIRTGGKGPGGFDEGARTWISEPGPRKREVFTEMESRASAISSRALPTPSSSERREGAPERPKTEWDRIAATEDRTRRIGPREFYLEKAEQAFLTSQFQKYAREAMPIARQYSPTSPENILACEQALRDIKQRYMQRMNAGLETMGSAIRVGDGIGEDFTIGRGEAPVIPESVRSELRRISVDWGQALRALEQRLLQQERAIERFLPMGEKLKIVWQLKRQKCEEYRERFPGVFKAVHIDPGVPASLTLRVTPRPQRETAPLPEPPPPPGATLKPAVPRQEPIAREPLESREVGEEDVGKWRAELYTLVADLGTHANQDVDFPKALPRERFRETSVRIFDFIQRELTSKAPSERRPKNELAKEVENLKREANFLSVHFMGIGTLREKSQDVKARCQYQDIYGTWLLENKMQVRFDRKDLGDGQWLLVNDDMKLEDVRTAGKPRNVGDAEWRRIKPILDVLRKCNEDASKLR